MAKSPRGAGKNQSNAQGSKTKKPFFSNFFYPFPDPVNNFRRQAQIKTFLSLNIAPGSKKKKKKAKTPNSPGQYNAVAVKTKLSKVSIH